MAHHNANQKKKTHTPNPQVPILSHIGCTVHMQIGGKK